jgi:modification methylase hphIB
LVYIDPPYPSTMNKYNEFYGSFDKMLNKQKEYINYAKKNQFLKYMKEIIKISKNKINYAVISLNNKSNPTAEDLKEDLKNEVVKIEILNKNHIYQITGKENKKTNYEILIICKLKE